MPNDELKACPFCGSPAIIVSKDIDRASCSFQGCFEYNLWRPIPHWNSRHKDNGLEELNEKRVMKFYREWVIKNPEHSMAKFCIDLCSTFGHRKVSVEEIETIIKNQKLVGEHGVLEVPVNIYPKRTARAIADYLNQGDKQ